MEVGIIGGILLAGAISTNYFLFGKLTNAYKPFDDVYNKKEGDKETGIAFVGGMMIMPYFILWCYNDDPTIWYKDTSVYDGWLGIHSIWQIIAYIGAGVLIGAGATMMGGGFFFHGVSATPKFSMKAIITAGITIGSAILYATLRSILEFYISSTYHEWSTFNDVLYYCAIGMVFCFGAATVYFIIVKENRWEIFFSFWVGAFLGMALLASGLLSPYWNTLFLDFTYWSSNNGIILYAMGIAAGLAIFLYWCADQLGAPKLGGEKEEVAEHGDLTVQTIAGAICYGIGWGWVGLNLCSGLAGMLIYPAFAMWIGGCFLGIWLFNYIKEKMGESDLNKPLIAA